MAINYNQFESQLYEELTEMIARARYSDLRNCTYNHGIFSIVRKKVPKESINDQIIKSCITEMESIIPLIGSLSMSRVPIYDLTAGGDIGDLDPNKRTYTCNESKFSELKKLVQMLTNSVIKDHANSYYNINRNAITFRVLTAYGSRYVYIGIVDTDTSIQIITADFIDKLNGCIIRKINGDTFNDLMGKAHTVLAISKRSIESESILKKLGFLRNMNHVSDQYLDGLISAVKLYIDSILHGDAPIKLSDVEFSRCESVIISKTMNSVDDANIWLSLSIKFSPNNDLGRKYASELFKQVLDKDAFGITGSWLQMENYNNFPLVAFTSSEWRFVTRYIEKLDGITDFSNGSCIDLRKYFNDQRYCKTLRFIYEDQFSDSCEILFSYEYNEKDDSMRLFVLNIRTADKKSQYKVLSVRRMIFTNVSDFNIKKSFCASDVMIHVNRIDTDVIHGTKDTYNLVPPCIMNDANIYDIAIHIISIYVIIHDRPQRHRLVREESVVTKTDTPSHHNKKQSHYANDSRVVSRVLMPVKDAKEYVERMSNGGDGSQERRYVIEDWNRCGHYRRLPHSEKTIWIDETTCHRHKPITDGDIVIKL